jgi:hypothetical protein
MEPEFLVFGGKDFPEATSFQDIEDGTGRRI